MTIFVISYLIIATIFIIWFVLIALFECYYNYNTIKLLSIVTATIGGLLFPIPVIIFLFIILYNKFKRR